LVPWGSGSQKTITAEPPLKMDDSNCSCEVFHMPDGSMDVEVCDYCCNPWSTEVAAIRNILTKWAVAENNWEKAVLVRTLLTLCLGYDAFLAANPIFRNALAIKVEEARADPVFGPLIPELLDNVGRKLASLPEREDYVA